MTPALRQQPGVWPCPSWRTRQCRTLLALSDGCWLWTGCVNSNGYGSFHLDGSTQYAHRVAYELTVGAIPDGLEIDHLYRNRRCVRPDHLEVVTHQQNIQRIFRRSA